MGNLLKHCVKPTTSISVAHVNRALDVSMHRIVKLNGARRSCST